ncbi:MAG: pyridoxal phosphate-dependent aminotransferase family protein, partial [Candidatus Thermoplasmatota archaeon]|nr:pyridoxal phosphate-dependent aminotransferase family protein [Candidatus Thermoplasmatota archaeon]
LANDPRLKEAAKQALDEYGVSMCGTPIVVGYTTLNKKLETTISDFLKMEETLVYPSGYQANIGLFKLLSSMVDVILIDEFAHSCLYEGTRLSKAQVRQFPHNDCERLKALLKETSDKRMRFIVVDGLYSTEGSIAKVDEMVELARDHDAFIIMDDAHGLGTIGETGRGSSEARKVLSEVHMITGSLGKALACSGGFVTTNHDIADYFRYYSSHFVYSTALPPAITAACIEAFKIVERSDARRSRLDHNKEVLHRAVSDLGFRTTSSTTPLFSIISKEATTTLTLARDLFERGVYAIPFIPPSVPMGRSCLRFVPSALLTDEDIEEVIEVFKSLGRDYS